MDGWTDTCEAKALLGAASAHLLQAVQQVDIAVLLADHSGNITFVNPHFTTLTGYVAADILGHSVEILRSTAHDRAFYHDLHEKLMRGKTWTGRIAIRRCDGRNYQARAVISPLRSRSGDCNGYSAFFRETADELKLEAQLRQVQKMEAIGELAAGIAHEINTPIQYVGDNIQFLRDAMTDMFRLTEAYHALCEKHLDAAAMEEIAALRQEIDWEFLQEEVPSAIDQALEGRNRVAEIVRAMKEFAHPGDETLTPIDINHAIENTLAVSRNEWKYIAGVKTELAENLPHVPCYPGSFNQVLLNLVVNAAHAIRDKRTGGTNEKGTITVATAMDGDQAVVRISDTGCGIAPEIKERVFEPFFTTKGVGKGTGQGLALAHSVIVERMKGTIDMESTPGEGTSFLLHLPVKSSLEPGETDQ